MNQNAQDLMMNAPSEVSEKQLKELNISLKIKNNYFFLLDLFLHLTNLQDFFYNYF